MKIEFAKGLSFPEDAGTQTFGIIARKGAGKSYAAGKLVEGFAKTQTQFVVMTPLAARQLVHGRDDVKASDVLFS